MTAQATATHRSIAPRPGPSLGSPIGVQALGLVINTSPAILGSSLDRTTIAAHGPIEFPQDGSSHTHFATWGSLDQHGLTTACPRDLAPAIDVSSDKRPFVTCGRERLSQSLLLAVHIEPTAPGGDRYDAFGKAAAPLARAERDCDDPVPNAREFIEVGLRSSA